jgi:predicted dehydrogenase
MSFNLAVVGCGRMGKLHARVASELDQVTLAGVVDRNAATAQSVAKQRDCVVFDSTEDAARQVDAAVIAVPTTDHLVAAEPFLKAGKSVLIEKPLSPDVATGQRILDLAAASGAIVKVGHTERYNPAVLAMKRHAIGPKFIEAHRISPFTFRSADVGVVLDMMIHDIDLVLMLAGGKVVDVQAVGVNVVSAPEDICNARVTFDNGCVANITASRLAIKTERKMRLFSEEAYMSVDFAKKLGIIIDKTSNRDVIQMAREMDVDDLAQAAAEIDYKELINVQELQVDDSNEPLGAQMLAFRAAVVDGAPVECSGVEGLMAVQLASDIVDKIKGHRWDGSDSARQGLDILDKS